MITTILFDLDGTLVHFEFEDFLKAYLKAIGRRVSEFIDPQAFLAQLLASSDAMVRSLDGAKTNRDVFMEHFFTGLRRAPDELMPVIDAFYDEDFPRLRDVLAVMPHPLARPMLEELIDRGYDVVIATNPVFPANAIEERMRWGGIDGLPYAHVTSYEISHYCKPNTEYYAEILDTVGREPHECLMVGNDTCEDLVAVDLGITTYLVEDYALDKGPFRRDPDYRGRFADLERFFSSDQFAGVACS